MYTLVKHSHGFECYNGINFAKIYCYLNEAVSKLLGIYIRR